MGLFDEVAEEQRRRIKGPSCSIAVLRAQLDPADLADFDAALDNPTITSAAIAAVLIRRGVLRSRAPLERHRGGSCACGRP